MAVDSGTQAAELIHGLELLSPTQLKATKISGGIKPRYLDMNLRRVRGKSLMCRLLTHPR
jgi:hypothetical protein